MPFEFTRVVVATARCFRFAMQRNCKTQGSTVSEWGTFVARDDDPFPQGPEGAVRMHQLRLATRHEHHCSPFPQRLDKGRSAHLRTMSSRCLLRRVHTPDFGYVWTPRPSLLWITCRNPAQLQKSRMRGTKNTTEATSATGVMPGTSRWKAGSIGR